MRLLIIRHGESEADLLHVHEGRADFSLTPRGHRQAEAMSDYVSRRYSVDQIYSSTLKRAVQTAEHLQAKTHAPLRLDPLLMEFNNGLIAGLSFRDAQERYPKRAVPPHASVYEQESRLAFRYRAEYMLSKLLSETGESGTAAVVTHGGMIVQLYRAFLGLPVDAPFSFRTGDTGIHEWLIEGDSRSVVRANFPPHSL